MIPLLITLALIKPPTLSTHEPGALAQSLIEAGYENVPTLEATPDAQNIDPVYPDGYQKAKFKKGKNLHKKDNTLTVDGVDFPFIPLYGNTGIEEEYQTIMNYVDQEQVVATGMNGIHAFYGHYSHVPWYKSIFNQLIEQDLIKEGNQVQVTDDKGLTKTYEITQIIHFKNTEQYDYFYDQDPFPYLPFFGNGEDMVYIQYCRWDLKYGWFENVIGYRVD